MNKDIKPVLLTKEDIPQIDEIGYSYWYEDGVYSKGVLEKIFKDQLSYGIKIKDELVAFSIFKKTQKEVIVFLIAVKNTHLRQGLGRKILKYTIENAAEKGHKNFILHVAIDNEPAQKLYSSVGFLYHFYLPNYYSPNKYNMEVSAYQMGLTYQNKNNVYQIS